MSDMRILRRMDSKMLQPILETLHEDDIIIIDFQFRYGKH